MGLKSKAPVLLMLSAKMRKRCQNLPNPILPHFRRPQSLLHPLQELHPHQELQSLPTTTKKTNSTSCVIFLYCFCRFSNQLQFVSLLLRFNSYFILGPVLACAGISLLAGLLYNKRKITHCIHNHKKVDFRKGGVPLVYHATTCVCVCVCVYVCVCVCGYSLFILLTFIFSRKCMQQAC